MEDMRSRAKWTGPRALSLSLTARNHGNWCKHFGKWFGTWTNIRPVTRNCFHRPTTDRKVDHIPNCFSVTVKAAPELWQPKMSPTLPVGSTRSLQAAKCSAVMDKQPSTMTWVSHTTWCQEKAAHTEDSYSKTGKTKLHEKSRGRTASQKREGVLTGPCRGCLAPRPKLFVLSLHLAGVSIDGSLGDNLSSLWLIVLHCIKNDAVWIRGHSNTYRGK